MVFLSVCVTGNFWREASYEKQDGTDKIGYRLNIGLHQANITMTRTSIEDTVTEFHNLKIGWREGEGQIILSHQPCCMICIKTCHLGSRCHQINRSEIEY